MPTPEDVMSKHSIDMRGMTPTQRKLVVILADGELHWIDELRNAVDKQADNGTIAPHLSAIRKLLTLQDLVLLTHIRGRGETLYSIRLVSDIADPPRPA